MKKHKWKVFFLIAVCAAGPALYASEIRIAISKPPSYYDPRQGADSVTSSVLSQVYETPLLYTAAHPEGAPNLFASIQKVDSKTYVGTLVFGVTFSDGESLTAAEMSAWLATVPDIGSRATLAAGHEGQNETVTFHLKEPDQYFSTLLMMNYCAVARETSKGVFVGTGPFVLGAHDSHQIVLEKNPHYHEVGQPKVDRLIFTVYLAEADGTNPKLLEAISRGEVDYSSDVPLSSLPQLQTMRSCKSIVLDSKNTGWLSFNLRRPPFNELRLRLAVAALLDFEAIVKKLYPVGTHADSTFLPPALAAAMKGVEFDQRRPRDAARAKSELESLGYTPQKKLKATLVVPWVTRPYCNNPVLFGEFVRKSLEDTGIVEVKVVVPKTGDEYFQSLLQGKFDLAANGWIADGPNPADFVEANLSSGKIGCLSDCNNMTGWSNPKVDAAIREIRASGSVAGFRTIAEEFRKDVPLVPFVHGPGVMVFSRRLHEIEPSAFSFLSFRTAYLAGS